VPLNDPRLREMIHEVERKLTEFEKITDQRRAARESAISGTDIDQRYDAVFGELISVASDVERELHQVIRQEIQSVRRAQIFVIAGGVILSVLVGILFARYIREREHAERILVLKVQAEKEAREHLGRLAHVVRLGTMSELAAEIAHEINQPLAAISASAAACRRLVDAARERSAEFRSALELIDSESNRASDVLRRLRTFIGRRDGCFDTVDVNELVQGVVKLAGFDPQMRRAAVRLELADDLPTAEVDSVQIQQVLLNLLRNGLEAMDDSDVERESVVVRTRVDDGRAIEVSVVDRGAGLPTEAAGDPFQAFFTTKESGMGIGLSISKSIISAHGGRIWCRRDDEAGRTTFAFTLPTVEMERS
jgi:C4-dicarboxylate-specific signal transduction histidine kinase